jgi:hypothetical protein
VHQQALATGEPGLGEERVVGGREHLRDPAGGHPVELVGYRHDQALVDRDQLCLAAAADHGHDAVTGGEAVDAGAALGHLTGELQAGDVGGRARRRRVATTHLQDVGAVDAGRTDADQDLAGLGLGVGVLLDDDALVADDDGSHARERTGAAAPETGRACPLTRAVDRLHPLVDKKPSSGVLV